MTIKERALAGVEMPLLDIWTVLEDPAWLFFGLSVAVGGGALAALFFLYPFGRD